MLADTVTYGSLLDACAKQGAMNEAQLAKQQLCAGFRVEGLGFH